MFLKIKSKTSPKHTNNNCLNSKENYFHRKYQDLKTSFTHNNSNHGTDGNKDSAVLRRVQSYGYTQDVNDRDTSDVQKEIHESKFKRNKSLNNVLHKLALNSKSRSRMGSYKIKKDSRDKEDSTSKKEGICAQNKSSFKSTSRTSMSYRDAALKKALPQLNTYRAIDTCNLGNNDPVMGSGRRSEVDDQQYSPVTVSGFSELKEILESPICKNFFSRYTRETEVCC